MGLRRRQQKTRRVKSDQPDLQFGYGELSGFTAAGVAGFHELNPAAVVRELLQNSLDAAREAGRDLVRILFKVEKHPINLVPGIKAYQSALKQAVADQKKTLKWKVAGSSERNCECDVRLFEITRMHYAFRVG